MYCVICDCGCTLSLLTLSWTLLTVIGIAGLSGHTDTITVTLQTTLKLRLNDYDYVYDYDYDYLDSL